MKNGSLVECSTVEQLHDEEAARIAGDEANAAAVEAEATARGEADTTLQSNIDACGETCASNLASVKSELEAADATLQANIDAEAQARTDADTGLQSQITQEISDREAADTTLQSNIDAEAAAREAADTAEAAAREAADTTLQSNIDACKEECAGNLASVKSELQSNIDAEAALRQSADTQLQANIDTEATARSSGDSALSVSISEVSSSVSSIASNVSSIATSVSTIESNLTTEIANREAADTALQSNIDAEATTREEGDEALQANIDTEAETREKADEELQTQIDQITDFTILAEFPTYAANGMVLDTVNPLPLSANEYVGATHDLLRVNSGVSITIGSGTAAKRVSFTSDLEFNPHSCLDTGSLSHGVDYYVYLYYDGSNATPVVSASSTMPEGGSYTADNTRKIGGFHYGTVRIVSHNGVPIDSNGTEWGSTGTIWQQNVVQNMVIPNSVWDLMDTKDGRHSHEDGLALVGGTWDGDGCSGPTGKYNRKGGRLWASIYLASLKSGSFSFSSGSNRDPLGGDYKVVSAYGATPITGSEGLAAYNFNEICARDGMRLPSFMEFCQYAFGNPGGEASANNYGYTSGSSRAMTGCGVVSATDGTFSSSGIKLYAVSAWNICDTVGNVREACSDIYLYDSGSTSWSWYNTYQGTDTGYVYSPYSLNPYQAYAGGYWYSGVYCGSRAVGLSDYAGFVYADNGLRRVMNAQ